VSAPSKGTGKLLRQLPSVDRLLERDNLVSLADVYGRREVVAATRAVLAKIRKDVQEGRIEDRALPGILDAIENSVHLELDANTAPSLVPLVNATGIIVHTNLGRAPLAAPAIEAMKRVAAGYSNLEFDMRQGKRGRRETHASRLLSRLFPGHDAHVVNNNAAAVLLALNTLAESREVVVSRGELVEIGGSFRIPDILRRSGATLREVGTTNKTRLSDYESAIGPDTGLILRVHLSNFRIIGFTEAAPTEELVQLGRAHGLPVVEDFGSGNLHPLGTRGLPDEPTVGESLKRGVDLVTFSGDKLLGGPQAGILVGTPDKVESCRTNPLARALRVDKLTYAALEATLASHVKEKAFEEVPVLSMLSAPPSEIKARSERFLGRLKPNSKLDLSIEEGVSKVGGGAAPEVEVPTFLIGLRAEDLSAQRALDGLRAHTPPVIARIADDRVLLDLRTVLPEQEASLQEALDSLEKLEGDSSGK
jgi:L-seryl-tRNA(Ser) seleniumtransferase